MLVMEVMIVESEEENEDEEKRGFYSKMLKRKAKLKKYKANKVTANSSDCYNFVKNSSHWVSFSQTHAEKENNTNT